MRGRLHSCHSANNGKRFLREKCIDRIWKRPTLYQVMKTQLFICLQVIIVFLLTIPTSGNLQATYRYEFGVAEQQLIWRFAEVADPAERLSLQLQMLDAMAAINIRWIRMSLIYPSNNDAHLFAHIQRCKELGIKVLIVLESDLPGLYPPETERRPGTAPPGKPQWPSFRLSELDLDLTEAVVQSFFEELQSRGLKIHALEIFNEINWNCFNGDLPLAPGGLLINENTPWNDPVYKTYRLGLQKKGEIARRINALNKKILNGDLKLITAGLVGCKTINPSWFANIQGALVSGPLTLQLLQGSHPLQVEAHNYLNYFDGVGIHLYPPTGNRDPETAYAEISADLDPLLQVSGVGTTLPLWITECGYTRSQMGYNEQARLEQLNIFYDALARYDRLNSSIEAVFHFTFSQMAYPEHAIWNQDGYYPSAAIFEVLAPENRD
jgi:hypothetical protein